MMCWAGSYQWRLPAQPLLEINLNREYMSYKEKMAMWMAEHPKATVAEAFEAGWFLSSEEWCHGKREKLEQIRELIKDIL